MVLTCLENKGLTQNYRLNFTLYKYTIKTIVSLLIVISHLVAVVGRYLQKMFVIFYRKCSIFISYIVTNS